MLSPRLITRSFIFPFFLSSKYLTTKSFYSDKELFDLFRKDIHSNSVFVYMKGIPSEPLCGFSQKLCMILDREKVKYSYRNVLENDQIKEGIKKFTNWPTIPQLFIHGEFVGGVDIVSELFVSGELSDLLKKAKAISEK